jgi:putative ABC transport system permease protein
VSWLDGVARLAPGVSLAQAQAEVDAIAANVVEAEGLDLENMRLGLVPATAAAVDPYSFEGTRRNAFLLLGVTATLLLLAMTNTASLLLVRTDERARELALRLGIGASRGTVLRMLLAEALAYALTGAALGFALAYAVLSITLEPLTGMLGGAPTEPALLLHWRVLVFGGGLAVLTAVLAAISPAMRVMRLDINTSLKQGGSRGDRAGSRTRSTFVVGQVMLSVGLLTVALLLVRSFWHTAVIDPGFDPRQSLVASVDLLRQGYSDEQAVQAQESIVERLRAHPAVDSAAFAAIVPVQSGGIRSTFQRPGIEQDDSSATDINFVSPDYFTTMRIPLLRGRALSADDREGAPKALVINRTLAQRWFPGEDPIGQHLEFRRDELWEVVGIVGDSKLRNLREEPLPAAYMPLAQRPYAQANLVVRGRAADPWLLLPVLREAVHAVEPALPLFRTRTLDQHVDNSYSEATVMAWLLSAFAALAVALSAAGLYGLLSWQVRTRTREIGIRLAIGATADAVRRQFLSRGMTLTAVGVALGLGVAVWAGQFLEALLYGLSVHDPVTLAAVTVGFLLIALLATWAPAARSARIDPMQALREE